MRTTREVRRQRALVRAQQSRNVTWDKVDFGDFPLKKKDIEKGIEAFNEVDRFLDNVALNNVNEIADIRKAWIRTKDEWRMKIVPGIKKAIEKWNAPEIPKMSG